MEITHVNYMEAEVLHRSWVVSNVVMIDRAISFLMSHRTYTDLELDDEQERVIQRIFDECKDKLPLSIPQPTEVEVTAFNSPDLRQSMETFSNMKTWDTALNFYKDHEDYEDLGLVEEQEDGIKTIFREFKTTLYSRQPTQPTLLTQPTKPVQPTKPGKATKEPKESVQSTAKTKRPRFNGWTLYLKIELKRLKSTSQSTLRPAELMQEVSLSWKELSTSEKDVWKEDAKRQNTL